MTEWLSELLFQGTIEIQESTSYFCGQCSSSSTRDSRQSGVQKEQTSVVLFEILHYELWESEQSRKSPKNKRQQRACLNNGELLSVEF